VFRRAVCVCVCGGGGGYEKTLHRGVCVCVCVWCQQSLHHLFLFRILPLFCCPPALLSLRCDEGPALLPAKPLLAAAGATLTLPNPALKVGIALVLTTEALGTAGLASNGAAAAAVAALRE
jgi:hypothetical protein